MEIAIVILLTVIVGSAVGFGIVAIVFYVKAASLESEVRLLLEEYKVRCNGSNRFLFNERLMTELFPEYNLKIIRHVWARLVLIHAIERDVLDGEWCIK